MSGRELFFQFMDAATGPAVKHAAKVNAKTSEPQPEPAPEPPPESKAATPPESKPKSKSTSKSKSKPKSEPAPKVEAAEAPAQAPQKGMMAFYGPRQKLLDEMKAARDKRSAVDRKLAKIQYLKSDEGEILFPEDARLVASEANLRRQRADLDDQLQTSLRSYQGLGVENVPGVAAAPTGEGYAAARLAVMPRPTAGPIGGNILRQLAARYALKQEEKDAPSGRIFAPTPPGGVSQKALEALKERLKEAKKAVTERRVELMEIEPRLDQMVEDIELHRPEARDSVQRKIRSALVARKRELLRQQKEDAAALTQMQRSVERMESMLPEPESE